jgi:DNA invertase Pin-like site-specific DNA recombinase
MPRSAPDHNPPGDGVPCAIYARISEDPDQDENGVNRQLEDCRGLIAQRFGWELAGEYVDNDISATKNKPRPEYHRLLADVDAGRIKVIVVYTTSRLLRTRRERVDAVEKFAAARVRIQPVRGPELNFDSPAGRMLAGILGEVDAHETEQMAERISRAMRQGAERGDYNGPRPFGYDLVMETDRKGRLRASGMLQINEAEAAHITGAVDRIIDGDRPATIVREWNSRGITTVRGNRWTVQSLQQMLLAPYLAGLRARYPRGSDMLRVRDKPIVVYEGRWPAILAAERQDALAAVLTGRRNPNRSGTNVKHMLSGIITCGRCGRGMWSGMPGGGSRARAYVCPTGHLGRAAEVVERWVEFCVFHWWEPNGALDKAREIEARTRGGETGAGLLGENRADRALLERLEDKLADELLDQAAYLRQKQRIEDRIAHRDEVIAQWQRQNEADAITERGDALRGRWRADGKPFQWRVLEASVAKVIVHPVGKGGKPFDPRAIEVIPGGILGQLDPADPVLAVPAPAAGLRRARAPRRAVRALFAANPGADFTPREVAGKTGLSLASVRPIVAGMRKDGEIVAVTPLHRGGGGEREARYRGADADGN